MSGKEVNDEVYRTSFQELTAPSYILDEHYHIIDLNKAMCDLLRYSYDKLLGSSISDLFADQLEYGEIIKKLNTQNEISLDSLKLKNGLGVVILLVARLKKLDIQGNSRFYGTLQYAGTTHTCDGETLFKETVITTRQVARSIGHEIRNPLTNLTLAIDQLAEEVGEDEENQLYFNIINRNANRIESLISNMLESTKVIDIYPELVDLNQLLGIWMESIHDIDRKKNIELDIQLKKDIPKVEIDPENIYIAFRNILMNAFKAVEKAENGQITIKTSSDHQYITITIEDNGVGIGLENISKVFSPFFTGDEKWGSGLGLTQAKNIIKAHQGNIHVVSELGKGSTFSILLEM